MIRIDTRARGTNDLEKIADWDRDECAYNFKKRWWAFHTRVVVLCDQARSVRVCGRLVRTDHRIVTIMGMSSDVADSHSTSLHKWKIVIRKLSVVFRCESETTTSHRKAEFLRARADRAES